MLAFIAGLGLAELSVILLLVLMLFGAGRLPQVFEALGKGVRALRQATSDDILEDKQASEGK